MKNIFKKFIMMTVLLGAVSFITSAQSNKAAGKTAPSNQAAAQTPADAKFFNIPALDEKRDAVQAAYTVYQQATKEKHDEMHFEYLKSKRLYIIELEKNINNYPADSPTGQKLRDELKRVQVAD